MKARIFPSFLERPTKIHIADQEPDEEIELFLRQHWIINVPWIFWSILAIFVPYLVLNFRAFFGFDFIPVIPQVIKLAAASLWYLLLVAYIIENFLHWYFNIYVITNLHLMDIEFENLLYKKFVEVRFDKVEISSVRLKGLFSSLFNYGDVIVQTAAEAQNVSFMSVPYPNKVADLINDLAGQAANT